MTMPDTQEVRSLLEPPEFRSVGDGKIMAAGVAMRYGARSNPLAKGTKMFREVFAPGSLARTITEQEVRAHNEHGGPYLGSTANGSLRFEDSATELRYELDLPDTTAGRDAATLLERRDIRGSSIGFRALPGREAWSVDDTGMALRTVHEARLGLCDLTVAPAYSGSTAALALRSLADERGIELRALLEAADRGELPTLIASPVEDENQDPPSAGDDPVVVRERISWLY